MQKRICKCLQKKLYTGEGDGFHKKKNKEELYTKMMGIGEGGFSQVRVFKKKVAQGGWFPQEKKARLAIHKNDGLKRRWSSPGKVFIGSPMFDKIKWILFCPMPIFPVSFCLNPPVVSHLSIFSEPEVPLSLRRGFHLLVWVVFPSLRTPRVSHAKTPWVHQK